MDRTSKTQDRAKLDDALRRARIRAASAAPGSPDWDAAMAAIEDLEARLMAPQAGQATASSSPRRYGRTRGSARASRP